MPDNQVNKIMRDIMRTREGNTLSEINVEAERNDAFGDRFGTWARLRPNSTPEITSFQYQDRSEIAELIVRGDVFDDWESVWVQHRWNEIPIFRFTAAERDEVPEVPPGSGPRAIWEKLQFRPGDSCTIKLGGQLAVTGVIETRQVAYDATNHGIMLIGRGVQSWAARSSVKTKTMNFDGKNVAQIAKEVWAPYPVGVRIIGAIDGTPFRKCNAEIGESTWDFIERLCRPRGIVLGTDYENNFLLIGEHSFPVYQQLIEGDNVLQMNCTITDQWKFTSHEVRSQTAASDDQNMQKAAQQSATAPGSAEVTSHLLTLAEQPVWNQGELISRARHEAKWHETTDVSATVIVQGWLRDGTNLWRAGDDVIVTSPMALLNGQHMKIEVVTYTQDRNSGTRTQLDVVNPARLNGLAAMHPGDQEDPYQAEGTTNQPPENLPRAPKADKGKFG
jgi:prophage tail gpP-like protein